MKRGVIQLPPIFSRYLIKIYNTQIYSMSRYNLINFENHRIIIIIDNDNIIWFNAKQICIALEYKQAKKQ